jgi:N-hydroxyarylamine O-acetyltransferase
MRAKFMDDKTATVEAKEIGLDAYCRRIGYTGAREPTLAVLREIHRLHPQAIAFENLDPILRQPTRLDASSLQCKLIEGGRGGYCFEQNMLLSLALRAIGFDVTDLSGRVRYGVPEGVTTPRTHMLLLIAIEGERHIADVGFGANVLTAPLRLDLRGAQETPHEPFRLVETGPFLQVEVLIKGEWTALYRFDLEPQSPSDLELGNWYMSTNPRSRFYDDLVVTRALPDGRYALDRNRLALHRRDRTSERHVLETVADVRDALGRVFGLNVPQGSQADAALARATGAAP